MRVMLRPGDPAFTEAAYVVAWLEQRLGHRIGWNRQVLIESDRPRHPESGWQPLRLSVVSASMIATVHQWAQPIGDVAVAARIRRAYHDLLRRATQLGVGTAVVGPVAGGRDPHDPQTETIVRTVSAALVDRYADEQLHVLLDDLRVAERVPSIGRVDGEPAGRPATVAVGVLLDCLTGESARHDGASDLPAAREQANVRLLTADPADVFGVAAELLVDARRPGLEVGRRAELIGRVADLLAEPWGEISPLQTPGWSRVLIERSLVEVETEVSKSAADDPRLHDEDRGHTGQPRLSASSPSGTGATGHAR